ncbi:unnamed protein product [Leuciscus chuanchicus]
MCSVSQMLSVQIQSKLKSTEISEYRGKRDIKIGTVHYVLSNMRVVECSMPDPSLVFVEGTGVSVEVSQLTLAITGKWATQFGIIHANLPGSFDLAVYNIHIYTLLQLADDAGRLSITTVQCSANVGDVNIQFHGGARFFFKPFVSGFSGQISDMIREKICPAIQQAINGSEETLQEIPVNITVDQYISLSIPLTSSPAVTHQSFELDIKGEFYSRSSPSEPPFSASVFDVPYAENYMLSVAASEFLVNSAAYAFLSSGALQINITDDMLRTLYPNMEMQVLLYASETPLFSFSSGVIDIHVPAAAKFSAVKPDGTLVPLFRLDVDGSFSGSARIDQNLTGAFQLKNLTLTLGSSEIGDFKGFVAIFTDVQDSLTGL